MKKDVTRTEMNVKDTLVGVMRVGNMRDYADIIQLVILVNLENLNAEMINQGILQSARLQRLNEIVKNN